MLAGAAGDLSASSVNAAVQQANYDQNLNLSL